jgi:superfamily I DNA/RNA helicase
MRERLAGSGVPSERMPIMTIHAFATSLLREYAPRVPHAPDEAALTPDFRILDETDAFLLMEELLGVLPLHYYRSLGNPTAHLRTLLADFSRARDGLFAPAEYLAMVEAMPLMPSPPESFGASGARVQAMGTGTTGRSGKPKPPPGTYTAEQIARAQERALAYGVWDRELRRRGLVDFGGLIQRAVDLLRADPDTLADVRRRYPEVLVDEFQDTNRAAAELLLLVAGTSGSGLWVVGDRNQSIYRFRGASPSNLQRLVEHYPALRVLTLRRCYRSVPDIVRLGSAMAARMAVLASKTANTTGLAGGGETAPTAATAGAAMSTLHQALQPLDLEPVRSNVAHAAIRRSETFVSAAHERVGLAAAIEQQRACGYAYANQAVLCRTHKQVRQIAAVLASEGVPVSQLGDFFDRPAVKDALMLVALAAGPDARGVLRAAPLLVGLGYPPPAAGELAAAARALAAARQALPGALRYGTALDGVAALPTTTRAALTALGEVATQLRNSLAVGLGLADFLLRPGGYAWRLVRIADGLDVPQAGAEQDDGRADLVPGPGLRAGVERPAQAQQTLAALGELVRLAWRFDTRWAHEPDFRARLSRAVTHWLRVHPTEPDALETVPDADVAPVTPVTPDGLLPASQLLPDSSARQATATAPAVRCFQHYLSALRAADVAVPVPGGQEDAVHVLTLHQSKGLEFPVVYLPGLAQGQFPAGAAGRDEVCPPGFRESDAPSEREAEERCLFYVGVTRACDVVAFTRATSYGRTTAGSARTAEPSPLLALVDVAGVPHVPDAAPLLPNEELSRLVPAAARFEEPTDETDDGDEEPAEEMAEAGLTLDMMTTDKPVFRLHELHQYLTCPQQYKYARGYGLLDPAQDAVYRFHRYIRRGAQALRDIQATAPAADWQAAKAHLQVLWETDGPAGHAYDAFYWQAAEAMLREEWRAITAPEGAADSSRALLAQPLKAELRRCVVEVTADRVIVGSMLPASGPAVPPPLSTASAPPLTVLVRLHTGRRHEEDKNDLALPLYYLAHHQQHPGAPVHIALAYAGGGGALAEGATDAAATQEPGPGELVDVTEIARQAAEKYLRPDRRQRSRLDKLDEAALGIAAGRFGSRPQEQRCAACAYCYVCPEDPDGAPTQVPQPPVSLKYEAPVSRS